MAKTNRRATQEFLYSVGKRTLGRCAAHPDIGGRLLEIIADRIASEDEWLDGEVRNVLGSEGIAQFFCGAVIYQGNAVLIGSNGGNAEFGEAVPDIQRTLEGSKVSIPERPLISTGGALLNRRRDFEKPVGSGEILDLLMQPELYEAVPISGAMILCGDGNEECFTPGTIREFSRIAHGYEGYNPRAVQGMLEGVRVLKYGIGERGMGLLDGAQDMRQRLVRGNYQLGGIYSRTKDAKKVKELDTQLVPGMTRLVKLLAGGK